MGDISSVIDELVADGVQFSKDQLIELIQNGKTDTSELISEIGDMTEKYLRQRMMGEITNSELKELMEDVLDLNEMQYNKLSVEAKVRADNIRDGLRELVVNRLLALI